MCQSKDDYETRRSGGKGTRDKFQRAPTSKYTSALAFHPIPHGPTWQGIGPSTSSSAAQRHSQWATVTCAMASKYTRQDLHHHCESTEPAPNDMFISYIYILWFSATAANRKIITLHFNTRGDGEYGKFYWTVKNLPILLFWHYPFIVTQVWHPLFATLRICR